MPSHLHSAHSVSLFNANSCAALAFTVVEVCDGGTYDDDESIKAGDTNVLNK